MSQTDDDRAWWEERRRLEVDQWRAWALELLRIPPDEADEPTSESLRAAIANRLRLTKALSTARAKASSPKAVSSTSLDAARSHLRAAAIVSFLSHSLCNAFEGKEVEVMIEIGSLVTLKSGGKAPLTVMSLKPGDGTESGRLCRVSWEMSPGRIESKDDVPVATLKLWEPPPAA